jgi:hypothetical protein
MRQTRTDYSEVYDATIIILGNKIIMDALFVSVRNDHFPMVNIINKSYEQDMGLKGRKLTGSRVHPKDWPGLP